ncbi:DUF6074 family protein [Devosia sp. 2618]|uniref:DUF6074 family protein n=1 Tax=Devosia sp. 2618 TaxID=3156454 RepID=UPI0033929076
MSEQLDLLSWQPPAAIVLPFPQRRNIGQARRVAAMIDKRKSQQSRQRCFDQELWKLCQSLKTSGLSGDQINRQLDDFTAAVNAEIWRLDRHEQRPGGAA